MYATPLLTIYFLVVIYTSAYPLSALRVWLAGVYRLVRSRLHELN